MDDFRAAASVWSAERARQMMLNSLIKTLNDDWLITDWLWFVFLSQTTFTCSFNPNLTHNLPASAYSTGSLFYVHMSEILYTHRYLSRGG